jgi:EAL domain-containing protein (putative c-di-GMP-specific phosphodiesterase class I)/GGDEF domain-containing protein
MQLLACPQAIPVWNGDKGDALDMLRDYSKSIYKIFDVIEHQRIEVLFQPILDIASCSIIGYEGQVRGPSDDLLHSPSRMQRVAKQAGKLLDLENLCCQLTIGRFAELKLQGVLFLRLNAAVFLAHKFKEIHVVQFLEKAGIDPEHVVITLQVDAPYDISHPNFLPKILTRFNDLGFKTVLEDQGEMFALLHSEFGVSPTHVFINPFLIQDIDKDPVKVQLIKSLLEIAEISGLTTMAEGIATRGELLLARDMGISLGKGPFVAGAGLNPARVVPRAVRNLLATSNRDSQPDDRHGINAVLEMAPAFTLENNNEDVFQVFEKNPQISLVAVTNNKLPVGLVNRSVFINRFARPYQRELYGKKSCSTFMDPEPLIVDRNISIQELSRLLAEDQRHVSLGFIFTDNGQYLGVGTSQSLIHEITEMQIQSARYANPLTGLPGNSPIDEHINLLLATEEAFTVCYFDLDHFKPFNDVYGFSMGDAMIQMTAKVIAEACDHDLDFVGHIGGDDFIVLFQSIDWEARCRNVLAKFGLSAMSFFEPIDIERGGYIAENRRGEKEFHNLTTLSIGAVPVKPKMFKSHRNIAVIASESKKMAKSMHGNSLFVNQRNYAENSEELQQFADPAESRLVSA